jgi:7-carboxy-7-deazaguanine synthase
VDPKQIKANARFLNSDEIQDEVRGLTSDKVMERPYWVTLSGGDPCMWQLGDLVERLHEDGYLVAVETQGALWRDWLRRVDLVTLSPKPPSSGMELKLNPQMLNRIIMAAKKVVLKIVVFSVNDFLWAKTLHQMFPEVTMYLSAGTDPAFSGQTQMQLVTGILHNMQNLVDLVKSEPAMYDCIVLPQLHALLWGHMKGV